MVGVPGDPIQLNAFPLVFGRRSIYGSLSGTPIDSGGHSCLPRPREYPPDDRDSSSRIGCDGYVRAAQGRKWMSMLSKPKRKGMTVLQATSTQTETGEVSVGNSARDERIRRRAYEIYHERGEQPGLQLDDWLQAERELERGTFLNPERGSATADDTRPLLNCHDLGDC